MVRIGNFLFHYRNGLFPVAFALLLWKGRPLFDNDLVAAGIGFAVALLGQGLRAATIGLAYIWAPACLIVYAAMGIYFMLWRPSQVDEIEGADASGETRDQASSAEA